MDVRSGVPCWVDLCSPDAPMTVRFYAGVFGWTARPSADDPDYTDCYAAETPVAAIGPVTAEGQPVSWTTYVATDDADEIASRVLRNGGTMLMAPTAVSATARLALFRDPDGAPFGAWQPAIRPSSPPSEHGTLAWNELTTRDPRRAQSFYHQVFGWSAVRDRQPEHTTWLLGSAPIGGMITMTGGGWQTPARWTAYFAVDDCDEAARRVRQLGGTVAIPPTDTAAGRFALAHDPHGAMFSLLAHSRTAASVVG